MEPAPVSWQPSQYWDGDSGSWSSFGLRVGNPPQVVRVLPSTAGQATWVVDPSGCPPGIPGTSGPSSCPDSRGGLFNISRSASWHALGNDTLEVDANLGYGNLSGTYGLDSITLGFSNSVGGPELQSQIVTALAPKHYFNGLFGLNHQATNISNFSDPHPSALTTMKQNNVIPSLSWAYTAGAQYQSTGAFASLTFGGYDASRFIPNNLSFNLAQDVTRDLVVGLQSIVSTTNNQSRTLLLPNPILTFIDSTQPYIYLPVESCAAFEKAFQLVWNDTEQTYWISDDLHERFLLTNPKITFTIGGSLTTSSTVDITLPYASFDLEALPPAVLKATRFFPLRRAASLSQYTLGRTFFQEAYVITDYERSNFSVSQSAFDVGRPMDIVTIHSTTKSNSSGNLTVHNSTPVSTPKHKAVIGGSVSGAVLFFLALMALYLLLRKRRRSRNDRQAETRASSGQLRAPRASIGEPEREIASNSMIGPFRELADTGRAELRNFQTSFTSGAGIAVMADSGSMNAQEMRTQRSSQEMLTLFVNQPEPCEAHTITCLSPQSHIRIHSMDWTSLMATVDSKSTRQSSTDSERVKTQIYASYVRKPLDLNRTLPPTPILESPMDFAMYAEPEDTGPSHPQSEGTDTTLRSPLSRLVSPQSILSKYSRNHGGNGVPVF